MYTKLNFIQNYIFMNFKENQIIEKKQLKMIILFLIICINFNLSK